MTSLTQSIFDKLTAPGSRIPWLTDWLLHDLWSPERYEDLGAAEFLKRGEDTVNKLEEVIAAAAPRLYDEFMPPCPPERHVRRFLEPACQSPTAGRSGPAAAVVFDGLSVREIPVLLKLAERSNLRVIDIGISFAAVPSETNFFIEQRLELPRISPSTMESRTELRDAGIKAYYFSNVNDRRRLDATSQSLLLWSAFPDNTYGDAGARFAQHFEQVHHLLETAWKHTVQEIPAGRRIVLTSDHGYIFFGHGLSASRRREDVQRLSAWFGGERWGEIGGPKGAPPEAEDDAVARYGNIALIRGRVQTFPPGPASARAYKHGGLSIMEMVTPWVVIENR